MRPLQAFALLLSLIAASTATAGETRPAAVNPRQETYQRLRALSIVALTDWKMHGVEGTPRGEAIALDDSAWTPLRVGEHWDSGSVWIRKRIDIPTRVNGWDVRGARVRLHMSVGSATNEQNLYIFANEAMVAIGYDPDPVVIVDRVERESQVLAAVRMLVRGDSFVHKAQLEIEARDRPDPRRYGETLMSADVLVRAIPEGRAEREKILDAAVAAVDWKALERDDQEAFDASLLESQRILSALSPFVKAHTIRAVGNTHIDVAWLWPWTETVEVTRATFVTALELLREYPDFKFTQSSALLYAWVEEKYPLIFEEIRRRVKEGRWEVIGGMWVEPDLNLPDGESLSRQLLYGKRYFQQKFGVDVKTGWNPDSFGYTWQLPQLYKKAGIESFVTQKLYWNETNPFPHKLFWWEAPDGSRVLSYFPHDYVNGTDPVKMATDLATYVPETGYPQLMHLYGVGDHGGGPTREQLDQAALFADPKRVYPKVEFSSAHGYFDDLKKRLPSLRIPVWKDELYLETHRGVQTSQATQKKNHRRAEEAVLTAERTAAIAWASFGQTYPAATLEDAWKKTLFNQFHDILPGSSVPSVYRDAERDYAEVQRATREVVANAVGAIAARADTRGPGVPLFVFNPLSWARGSVLEAQVSFDRTVSAVEVRDPSGKPVLSEVVARAPETRTLTVRFLAEDVPALGYSVYQVVPAEKSAPVASLASHSPQASAVKAEGATLENEYLRVEVDPASGCIVSLFDKRANRESVAEGGCGNLLTAFKDTPKKYDAWNLDADFEDVKWDLKKAESVKLVERSPLRAAVRVVRRFQSSTFTQDVVLHAKSARVEVQTVADWHEKHVLVKAAFPVAVKSEKATYEIPYGSIERPTTRRNSVEKAKFEVPALRWADLSDEGFGVTFLNDSKYGYDGKDNVLRLSLLRAPTYPDPHCDEGRHTFTYAFYPHAGGWRKAETMRQGYELNYALTPVAVTAHEGSLPAKHSFARIEPANVVLTALKKSEDGDAMVARFYEWAGEAAEVRLRVPGKVRKAVEANLLEADEKLLPLKDGEIRIPTRSFEIKTLKVHFH